MKNLLELLYPPRCPLCGVLTEKTAELCPECRKYAPFCRNGKRKRQFLDSAAAVWYYEGNVRSSLLRFKFGGRPGLSRSYGPYLGAVIRREYPEGFDYLTWVPTGNLRKLRRGYDQARLLAKAAGRDLGMPPVRLLRKRRNNPAQSGLSGPEARRRNVQGVYALRGNRDLAGKRILLIDDILTTGATAGECARVLRSGGAREVHCVAVAVAERE